SRATAAPATSSARSRRARAGSCPRRARRAGSPPSCARGATAAGTSTRGPPPKRPRRGRGPPPRARPARSSQPRPPPPPRGTPREADVLELAADGAPVEEIAARAHLAPGTVRNYLSSAAAKLGAANRHEAAHAARRHGWI